MSIYILSILTYLICGEVVYKYLKVQRPDSVHWKRDRFNQSQLHPRSSTGVATRNFQYRCSIRAGIGFYC